MAVCSHCRRSIQAHGMRSHASVCVMDKKVAAHIRSVLRAVSPYGVLLSRCSYDDNVGGCNGMPSSRTLLRTIGNWDAVARWAGLESHRKYQSAIWKEARSVLQDLAYRLHDGNFGPSAGEWDTYRPGLLPASAKLISRLITWSNVLAWAGGLQEGDSLYYARRVAERARRRKAILEAKEQARRKMGVVESHLVRQSEAATGIAVVGEPQKAVYYDWSTRSYRECLAASVR